MAGKNYLKIAILIALGAIIFAFFHFDLHQHLNFETLKAQRQSLLDFKSQNTWLVAGAFFLTYVIVTAASLPGATVLTLAGGALFGLFTGLLLVSFASTIGATLAFLSARFLLQDWVQSRFGNRLATINQQLEKDGAFYLFTLRLIPLFPFFVINLTMGLTPIPAWTFLWVSQLGMLPGTIVYVNAGTQLAELESLSGILSPTFILSFALLGLFPILMKKALPRLKGLKANGN